MVHKIVYDSKCEKRLKILSIKQMLERLSLALAQVKAGNRSQNLLNEIHESYILWTEKI